MTRYSEKTAIITLVGTGMRAAIDGRFTAEGCQVLLLRGGIDSFS